ncbi:hypothetical protein A0J57_04145 [Sphingobium sp. 22B]|uniref:TonB-dependent receptor n=1 Tax=unclassified Sphingobium TaxID=2611147 RepID=UPI000782848F|nr:MULTISPECIES: TonB-dependent receptor [unclassified Sphingobium]KYC33782.1 hypothetical protein A0J57_04145 [Sphingobium sp. 22B]OAP33518.1 hypothetical protein A8O16_03365 [Sphingobium sp. 20006FA]
MAWAQSASAPLPEAAEQGQRGTLLEDIIVTATKQSQAQLNQSVPATISAFSSGQIEALKLTNIQTLAYSVPNVAFDGVSSLKGFANFQIRGLGVNSSVGSTAPTVGMFVDGIYVGVPIGVLLDTFDLDGIEVLRGPQGTLFGRNVTGGAVLLRNAAPRQEADLIARVRVETGPEVNIAVAGGGGLTDTISGRLAVLYRHDAGYFNNRGNLATNSLNGRSYSFSKDTVFAVRPALRFESGGADIILRGEYGQQKGDGPVAKAFERDEDGAGPLPAYGASYNDVYLDERGSTDIQWYNASLNARFDVGFGENASITNIAGFRHVRNLTTYDGDGTAIPISHTDAWTAADQFSNELRYNGTFGRATITAGLFYFYNDLEQFNHQILINSTAGGRLKENVFGAFGQIDYKITDHLMLQIGGRYNYEKKKARIAPLASENPNVNQPGTNGTPGACSIAARACTYQYDLSDSWKNFSPKVGLQFWAADTIQFYATAQKAFRSGGYNVRYNSPGTPPPYDPEKQDAIEIGFKTDLFDRTTRFNGALFYTKIKDLQRDITVFDNVSRAAIQTTFNTADATTKGFEVEFVQQLAKGVIFNANVGYVHGKYDKIRYDITQDPVPTVDAFDYRQKLPRLAPWTYSAGITADHDFGFGKLTFRGNYSHRDAAYFPDYNTGRRDGAVPKMPATDIFDAQISYEPGDGNVSLTLYGKNLTNEFSLNSFTPVLYTTQKACACGLNEGRTLGVELSMKW